MLYFRLGVIVIFLLLCVGCWALYEKAALATLKQHVAEEGLKKAETVNRQNAYAMKRLQAEADDERRETAKALDLAKARAARAEQLLKEMDNAPGANDPAGPYWDEYSRRLRAGDGDRKPNH